MLAEQIPRKAHQHTVEEITDADPPGKVQQKGVTDADGMNSAGAGIERRALVVGNKAVQLIERCGWRGGAGSRYHRQRCRRGR